MAAGTRDCIRAAKLSEQTRVWLPGKPFGWIPGEIADLLPQGKYTVQVADLGKLQLSARSVSCPVESAARRSCRLR